MRTSATRVWWLALLGAWVGCAGPNERFERRPASHEPGAAASDVDDEDAAVAAAPDASDEPAPQAPEVEPAQDAGAMPAADAGATVPDGSFAAGTKLATTADLNLRDGPGTDFQILATIPTGTVVTVEKTSGADGWVNVAYDVMVGYASKDYLEPAP